MRTEDQVNSGTDLVKRVRTRLDLTQKGLASLMGVGFATVNAWETGRKSPSGAEAAKLVDLATDGGEVDNEQVDPAAARSTPANDSRLDADFGWNLHDSERCDFLHRIRKFPTEVNVWRAATVRAIKADEGRLYPLAGRALDVGSEQQTDTEILRELLDQGISRVREVARILSLLHGNPPLGNKADPTDELIYIILSRKTREKAYQDSYERLKARFPRWDDVLEAEPSELQDLLAPGGLGSKKARSVVAALEGIKERFGDCSLDHARDLPDQELEGFLCGLPEVSRKSAYCVMMYAFGRAVFPVDAHVGRLLARLGIYRELGLDLLEVDHKQRQAILADLIPPPLRHHLHVNLVAHGRETCRARNPKCGECDLRKLCSHWRRAEVERADEDGRPTTIDLFCGAGGVSAGFEEAGFRTCMGVDANTIALKTFSLNHPTVPDDCVVDGDIRAIAMDELRKRLDGRRLDVVIGAPPCQGFSHVGQRSKRTQTGYRLADDARNFLYQPMMDIVCEFEPSLVLMENVVGMATAKTTGNGTSYMEAAAKELEDAGYETTRWRLNAAAYGVPQDRIRVFVVAARGVELPSVPAAHYQDLYSGTLDLDALPPITFDEATFDLPPREAAQGKGIDLWPEEQSEDQRRRRYLAKFGIQSTSRLLHGHWVRYHNERDLELYDLLEQGEDSVHALERHGRADLMRYRNDVFDDKYSRLRGGRPCRTIVAHLAKDGNAFIHPHQPRSISFREAARAQSFADDFLFCGAPSNQWTQLGNAVPPVLARVIAASFMRSLGRESDA